MKKVKGTNNQKYQILIFFSYLGKFRMEKDLCYNSNKNNR